MKVTTFSQKVAQFEGLKVQVNIAQIKEILRVSDKLLNGSFYKLVRSAEENV